MLGVGVGVAGASPELVVIEEREDPPSAASSALRKFLNPDCAIFPPTPIVHLQVPTWSLGP